MATPDSRRRAFAHLCMTSPGAWATRPIGYGSAEITSVPTPGGRSRRYRDGPAERVAQFVAAGFRKLHLDCSMSCADDPAPLPEDAWPAARRGCARPRSSAWREHGGDPPAYVIGTEVPAPGGAGEDCWRSPSRLRRRRGDDRGAPGRLRSGRSGRGLAARCRAGRPARRRVRSPQGHRLSAREGARAERLHRANTAVRLRGAFHRLPDAGESSGAGARPFRHSQGRAGRDLRLARDALGTGRDRTRIPGAAAGPGLREVVPP